MPLNNENNNECCKCTTPEYEVILNQQGPQGRQGEDGKPGFSPQITVVADTYSVYQLNITTEEGQITTPNLKANIPLGGSEGMVLTKNSSIDGDASFNPLPNASQENAGIVQLATADDLEPDSEGEIDDLKAVTPDLLSTYVEQEINAVSNNFVTVSGSQEITGTKTFYNNIVTNGITSRNGGTGLLNFDVNNNEITVGTTSDTFGDKLRLNTNATGTLEYQKGSNTYNIITTENIATTSKAGIVKPDGTTITVDADGTIHSVGGTGGTTDYSDLTNKPQINGHELTGNQDGNALGLANQSDLANYVDLTTNDQTISGIKIFQNGMSIDNIVSPGEYGATQIGPNNITYRSTSPEYQFYQLRPDQGNSYDLRIGTNTAKWNSVNINANALYLNGEPIGGGESYILPQANATTLGGIKANEKDETDTQEVKIDPATGLLYTKAGGGTAPTNMMTTDTTQTVSGTKNFNTTTLRAPNLYNTTGVNIIDDSNTNTTTIGSGKQSIVLNATNLYHQIPGVSGYGDILDSKNLTEYLIAGSNITLTPDSTGKITIASSGGGELPSNVLTSDNISQDAYIQQLEARIAALEALIDGGNANSVSTLVAQSSKVEATSPIENDGYVSVDNIIIEDN